MTTGWMWVIFNVFVFGMLALDLGVFNRKSHVVSTREALAWTGVWVALALAFAGLIYLWQGQTPALEFMTGYVIEEMLSIDNMFIFVLIFSYFQVPKQFQHRVLFWGVLGALVMRAMLIGVGAVMVERFHWILYLFGAFLVFTGIKMAVQKEQEIDPGENPVVGYVRKLLPVAGEYHGSAFFIREGVKWVATPLFLVLVMVETTDVLFAFDSIPAIFAVTTKAFIVYTSNVFAIMGLRSLYFLLAGVVDKFRFLKLGLSVVLTFVGVKMLAGIFGYHMPIPLSLAIVLGTVAVAIALSLLIPERPHADGHLQRTSGS